MPYYLFMPLAQPGKFLEDLDLLRFDLSPQGFRARTYWNDHYVLQKRPIEGWGRWQTVIAILEDTDDPDNLLLALEHEYELEDDFFWLRFPRLDLPSSPAHRRDLSPGERRDFFEKALPDYLALDRFLSRITSEKKLFGDLIAHHPQKTEAVMRYGEREIRAVASRLSYSPLLDYPKPLPYTYQHGDLSLGNTILTQEGYRLIDWESFAWYEHGRDLVQLFCFVLLPSPEKEWKGLLSSFSGQLSRHLSVSREEWHKLLYWKMLSEFLFWQRGEDLDKKMQIVHRSLDL